MIYGNSSFPWRSRSFLLHSLLILSSVKQEDFPPLHTIAAPREHLLATVNRATQPRLISAQPLGGRAALAILGRCSLDPYQSRYGPSLAPSKIANSATAPLYQPWTWCTRSESSSYSFRGSDSAYP